MNAKSPFFYDVTLRDGNQALSMPWNQDEKEKVFRLLCNLGVDGMEIGFPGASEMDFESSARIVEIAPAGMIVGVLARAHEKDILRALEAFKFTRYAIPRLHVVMGMSSYHMKYVLNMSPDETRKKAVEAIRCARLSLGTKGQIQFSPEHFGDSMENIDWVIDSLLEVIEAGVDVINLPNTVERFRPKLFVDLVGKVAKILAGKAIVAVHCHNDLGMATATTVESFFAGAQQLEVSLNGLGERAGNANLYEVAVTLNNSGVDTGLKMEKFYETAIKIAKMSKIPIHEKTPLVGSDAFTHRSGMHQHGYGQTSQRKKKAYSPIDPRLIGRVEGERLEFTSQSGSLALEKMLSDGGISISSQEAKSLQPIFKAVSEVMGVLSSEEIVVAYEALVCLRDDQIGTVVDSVEFLKDTIDDWRRQVWKLEDFKAMTGDGGIGSMAVVIMSKNGISHQGKSIGDGPVEAAFRAICDAIGIDMKLINYSLHGITEGDSAPGEVVVILQIGDDRYEGRDIDINIMHASIRACINAINKMAANKR